MTMSFFDKIDISPSIFSYFEEHSAGSCNENEETCTLIDQLVEKSPKAESQFGGFDEAFVHALPNDFKCPVCCLALRQPVQTEECGHRFCESCFHKLERKEGIIFCPLDRQKINKEQVFLDKAANRAILCLEVKCRHFERKCDWIGELSLLDSHLKGCAFADVLCPNKQCQTFVMRKDLVKHLEFQCNFRSITCQCCEEKFQFEYLLVHLNECPNQPLECVNKCGITNIQRNKMTHHVENDCPITVQPCEFSKLGCLFKGIQTQRDIHNISSLSNHLSLAIDKIMLLEKKKGFQEKQIDILEKKVADLEKGNAQLKSYITSAQDFICCLDNEVGEIKNSICGLEIRAVKKFFIWSLDDFGNRVAKAKKSLKEKDICSNPFYSAPFGYKHFLQIYLNGLGEHKGTHITLFFHIMKGEYDNILEWPFSKKVTLTLLDQSQKRDHKSFFIHPPTSNSELFSKPISQSKRFACLIPQTMAYPGYISMDDTLMIKCEVEP